MNQDQQKALTCGQQVSQCQQHQEPRAGHSRHQGDVRATLCPWYSHPAELTVMSSTPSPGPGSRCVIWRVSDVPRWPNPSEARRGREGPSCLFPGPDWFPGPSIRPALVPRKTATHGRGEQPARLSRRCQGKPPPARRCFLCVFPEPGPHHHLCGLRVLLPSGVPSSITSFKLYFTSASV